MMTQAISHSGRQRAMAKSLRQSAAAALAQETDRFITDEETAFLIGASRSWPWKLARDGKFPQPVKLSARCTRWRLSDVRAWMNDPTAWPMANGGES